MPVLEGAWDCSNCLHAHIAGRLKNCPTCGDPRNPTLTPEEKPYLPDDAKVLTSSVDLSWAQAGPDWNCGHCGEANRGDATNCAHCERQRDGDDFANSTTDYVDGKMAKGREIDSDDAEAQDRVDLLVPDPLDEAERLISGEADKPRKSHRYTRKRSALRKAGAIEDRVEEYREVASSKQKLREQGLPLYMWNLHRGKILLVGGASAAVLIALTLIGTFHQRYIATKPIELTVQSLSWEREVEIEAYRTLREEDWSIPGGGRHVSDHRAIHHYNHVLDHYKTETYQDPVTVQDPPEQYSYTCGSKTVDNGNGSFSVETETCTGTRSRSHIEYVTRTRQVPVYRDDPVYQTKYVYDIDRWVTDSWARAGGRGGELDRKPYWPTPTTSENRRIGDERREDYDVTLIGNTKTYHKEPSFTIWKRLNKGQTITGHITHSGKLRTIDWP